MENKVNFFKRASDSEGRKDSDSERRERKEYVVRDSSDRRERAERKERVDRPSRGAREMGGKDFARRRVEEKMRGESRGDRKGVYTQRRERGAEPRKESSSGGRKPLAVPENLIFGIHTVKEALLAGTQLEKLYTIKRGNDSLQEIERMATEAGVAVQFVPTPKLDYLSKQNNHQGVVATVAEIEYKSVEEILELQPTLVVVLDGVTDVRNFGAIARSAECAGVEALIIPSKNSAPINGEAMKSAAGALSRIPVCKVGSLRNTLKTLQLNGLRLVAATEKSEESIYDIDLTQPSVVIMGSEQRGVSSEVLKMCDCRGSIPMSGAIESLNVSAAAAVVLFEAVRQRSMV